MELKINTKYLEFSITHDGFGKLYVQILLFGGSSTEFFLPEHLAKRDIFVILVVWGDLTRSKLATHQVLSKRNKIK